MSLVRCAANLVPALYEDEHYLAVDKPAGIAVGPSGRRALADLTSCLAQLRACWPGARPDPSPLIAVEQMGRFASGPVFFAKSHEAAEVLASRLADPKTRNQYVAIVKGKPKSRHLATPFPVRKKTREGPRDRRPATSERGKAPAEEAPTRARRSDGESLCLELLRHQDGWSWVRFEAGTASEAELCRRLSLMGLPVMGEARFQRRPDRRQRGRYFLHRSQVTLEHPKTGRPIRVRSRPPRVFERSELGWAVVEEHLRTALAARLPCLLDDRTDAFRLLTGQCEGIPGLVAERFGPLVILEAQQGKFQGTVERLRQVGQWYCRTLGVRGVYLRRQPVDRSRLGSHPEAVALERTPLVGAPCDEEFVICENDLQYRVRPFQRADVGIFLDQRTTRQRVQELAGDRRVLNVFAYTCGFSVAAAGGAASVTSVDVKRAHLEWGKENLGLNGLPLDVHTFIWSEAFDYFARAKRQGKQFDLIVLDPPTFARSKKPPRVFRVADDLSALIAAALTVAAPQALVLISTNCRQATKRWLADQVARAAEERHYTVVGGPPLPVDFAVDPDHSKRLLVRLA